MRKMITLENHSDCILFKSNLKTTCDIFPKRKTLTFVKKFLPKNNN